jgi:lysophospholipase L1-like esterase
MTQPAYNLEFIHRFNLYQGAGLPVAEDDIATIARIYGISVDKLQRVEDRFRADVAGLADTLRNTLPPKPVTERYRIVAAGDSLTADRTGWVNILRAYWGNESGRILFNAGRSGETSADLKKRLDRDILTRSCSHVVLFIGANDCGGPRNSDGQVSRGEYARNMDYLASRLIEAGKTVVQITLPYADNDRMRRYFSDNTWVSERERVDDANVFIREQSRRLGTLLADLADALAQSADDPLMADGIHLNGLGQLTLAGLLARILP